MKLKVAIAEDEKHMRTVLKKALEPIEGVEVIYETDNGRDLIEHVEIHSPHAVFLDIEMPGLNGLEAAKEIVDIYPDTALVFVTGYPEHMAEAFDLYAFDYLVKPFDPERVRKTVKKIMRGVNTQKKAALYEINEYNRHSAEGSLSKLAVNAERGRVFLDHRDIVLVTREHKKTLIYTVGRNSPVQTNEPLNSIFDQLSEMFFRSHKSYIVNLSYVEGLDTWGSKSHLVRMKHTTETALVSNQVMQEIEERLS